jgi:hypothetical protein
VIVLGHIAGIPVEETVLGLPRSARSASVRHGSLSAARPSACAGSCGACRGDARGGGGWASASSNSVAVVAV